MAITSQLEIAKKTLKSLFPVNIETGAVGSAKVLGYFQCLGVLFIGLE